MTNLAAALPFSVPDADVDERLQLAIRLARSAGAILLSHLGRLERIDHKSATDFVTVADRESELHLVQGIAAAFPDDGILAEEGSAKEGHTGWLWVMDPLDGTTNFVHGFPFFMVAIGLLRGGVRVGGVCFAPVLNDLYVAAIGRGAFKNGARLAVSKVTRLEDSLACTGFPYSRRELVDQLLVLVGRCIRTTHGIRRTGSACFDQCLLATGGLDVYFEQGLKPWDLAGASLIAEEAGAMVTDYEGGPFDPFGDTVLFTNGLVHDEALARIVQPRP